MSGDLRWFVRASYKYVEPRGVWGHLVFLWCLPWVRARFARLRDADGVVLDMSEFMRDGQEETLH